MAKSRQKRALETRERILDCAIDVFHERGVARPSLSDIAELAGVTRGAVYGHFENKADLFSALCDRIRLPTEAISDMDPSACRTDPLGELRDSWVFVMREVASNPEWQKILDIIFHRCELVEESGQVKQRLHQGHRQGTARLTELLSQAVALGQLPADLNVSAAMPLLHSSLIGLLSNWLLRPEDFDLAGQSEGYVDALIHMLRTAPALRLPVPRSAAHTQNAKEAD